MTDEVSADPTEDRPSIEDQVLAIAMPRLEEVADKLKTSFMSKFGDFFADAHKSRLEELFQKAAENKLKALAESDPDKARQYAQASESSVRSIETLGLAASIKADAKAASLIKEAAAMVIETLGDVAFSLISGIGGALLSGLIGPAASKLVGEATAGIADSFRDDDQPA